MCEREYVCVRENMCVCQPYPHWATQTASASPATTCIANRGARPCVFASPVKLWCCGAGAVVHVVVLVLLFMLWSGCIVVAWCVVVLCCVGGVFVLCCVVWCGVVWCGVVLCGVVL